MRTLGEARWQKLSQSTRKGIPIASSAGNKSADKVNLVLVEAMNEKGIDISMKPKLPTFQIVQNPAYENPSPPIIKTKIVLFLRILQGAASVFPVYAILTVT